MVFFCEMCEEKNLSLLHKERKKETLLEMAEMISLKLAVWHALPVKQFHSKSDEGITELCMHENHGFFLPVNIP